MPMMPESSAPQQAPSTDMAALTSGVPENTGGQAMTGEDMKSRIDEMFSMVDDEYRKMNANKFTANNKAEKGRIDALRQVLSMLQQSGIDLNDPEQIKSFMDKLQQQDPDLLVLFVSAIEGLLGGEGLSLDSIPEGQAPEGATPDMNALGMPGGGLDVSQLSGMSPAGSPPPGMSPQGPQEMQGPPSSPTDRFPNLMR